MIPQISEINFPEYATLHEATASFAEMGDRTITTQVRIDGDIVPEFDGWELQFKGERFVLPTKDPQAQKNNTTRNSLVDLTFYSWPIYQMKRFFFFETTTSATGTVMADKYKASVNLNLVNFVALFNRVLNYYFDGKIVADLAQGSYGTEAAFVQLDYSYIWDVLQNFYEMYGVRWRMVYDENEDVYTIKIGYQADVIDNHEFEYGFEGGLLHFERQIEDDNIKNILLGRGGEKNLPYRYFKRTDPNNSGWAADPDAVKELENIYFDRLRDYNFRCYVQGWKTNPNRALYPGESVETYDSSRGESDWAYRKGHEDETFDPVEYVKDDESIEKYGERWGALDDNDDIYPTIQGISVLGLGRVDEVVAVSNIVTDDIEAQMETAAEIVSINSVMSQAGSIPANSAVQKRIRGGEFTVPSEKVANIKNNGWFVVYRSSTNPLLSVDTTLSKIRIYNSATDVEVLSADQGLSAGTYYYIIDITIRNSGSTELDGVTFGVNGLDLVISDESAESWKPTFDIWIKNIFNSERLPNETDEAYSLRIWGPILGDRLGNEAKIVFSDGAMSISEDYEFTIAGYPVPDNTKVTAGGYRSEWKVSLYKSDAEYDISGLYIPNNTSGGKPIAGDHFFFIGIDMPHMYVTLNEERLTEYKTLALSNMTEVNPTWVIHLDKVRADMVNSDNRRLFDQISVGCEMHVKDKRFTNNQVLTLFANSITYSWQEPSDGNPYILPDVEIVVSDKIIVEKSSSDKMRGDIENIKSTYAKLSDLGTIVPRLTAASFLKKNGEEDSSLSPTRFASLLTSLDFSQGALGGRGWGFYRDNSSRFQVSESEAPNNGPILAAASVPASEEERSSDAVLELDKLIVRKEMQVNNLVINQISSIGGKQIYSAAAMECVQVVETDDSFVCFFDQKQGSVQNLFAVGDIAMGQIFTPANLELRFYKMIVTETSVDSITLAKEGRAGAGVPQKGDVIVQYGNINNPSRQYVIVRDVIGGGYERMISGLNSVSALGQEYFFAGYDPNLTGASRGRFFIGGENSHMEFKQGDGRIVLKGNIVQSPSGDTFPVPCNRGTWTAGTKAYYGDLFYYEGQSWLCINPNAIDSAHAVTSAPVAGTNWRLHAQKGADGASAYRLYLTNDNMSVNADSAGNIYEGGYRPSCRATLFLGNEEITSGVVYSIQVPSGASGITIDSSSGVITLGTILSFSTDAIEVIVKANLGSTIAASATMNISKAKSGVNGEPATTYELQVTASQVTADKAGGVYTPIPSALSASAYKIVGANNPVPTDEVVIKQCFIRRSNGSRTALVTSSTVTLDSTDVETYSHVVFGIYKDGTLWGGEEETIPILINGQDGNPGGKGDRGPSVRGPVDLNSSVGTRMFYSGNGDISTDAESAKWIDLCYHLDSNGHQAMYRCIISYEGTGFVAENWEPANEFSFVATQVLFAENTLIKNGIIEYLRTDSGDVGHEKRIEAVGDTLTCYDEDGDERTIITAGDVDLAQPASFSTYRNQGTAVQTVHSYTGSGQHSQDYSETITPIQSLYVKSGMTVRIPSAKYTFHINFLSGNPQAIITGVTLALKRGTTTVWSSSYAAGTIVTSGSDVDRSIGGADVPVAVSGNYNLVVTVNWTEVVTGAVDFLFSTTIEDFGVAAVDTSAVQQALIGSNGVKISNGSGFASSFGIDEYGNPSIIFQGVNSSGKVIGLKIDSSGVWFSQGNKWELLSSQGGGGGGSRVFWTPGATAGETIGTLTIDGVSYDLKAPAGGGGALANLSDVDFGTLANYNLVYYSNQKWRNIPFNTLVSEWELLSASSSADITGNWTIMGNRSLSFYDKNSHVQIFGNHSDNNGYALNLYGYDRVNLITRSGGKAFLNGAELALKGDGASCLAAPRIKLIYGYDDSSIQSLPYIRVKHPLLGSMQGAEAVLMVKSSRNHSLYGDLHIESLRHYRRNGWCAARSSNGSRILAASDGAIDLQTMLQYIARYYTQIQGKTHAQMESISYGALISPASGTWQKLTGRHAFGWPEDNCRNLKTSKTFGIAVRVPNPAFNEHAGQTLSEHTQEITVSNNKIPRYFYTDVARIVVQIQEDSVNARVVLCVGVK